MHFLLHSRAHKLNGFPHSQCFVKRDDELSFGISGSKYRKYSSLMPYLLKKGYTKLVVIAGPYSNNLLAALQMAAEHKIEVIPFLLEPHQLQIKGNYLYSRLFLDEKKIHWFKRKDWPNVNEMAKDFIKKQKDKIFLLEEGAYHKEAFLGAKTIARSILQNEKELQVNFKHIFVDAGTGLSAIALIDELTKTKPDCIFHVLSLADTPALFHQKFYQLSGKATFKGSVFQSSVAKSFGAINQTIKQEIKKVAIEEGILIDPIYSAKLFLNARLHIEEKSLTEPVLIIHSGGALSLSGFDL